jgi:uracil-DNA glycosylase
MPNNNWKHFLAQEGQKPYFLTLKSRLAQRYTQAVVYPEKNNVMNAFRLTPFEEVRVVILGQDPYHGPNQAHGLSFSVESGSPPPSLRNIFKEIESSTGIKSKESGNLERWASQGVLLLNSVLTVEKGKPGSHRDMGWETFSDNAIKKLNAEREGIVFMLWGNYAKDKVDLINPNKHAILTAPHPSPFSAHTGFMGCDHFHAANVYLNLVHGDDINWE